MYTGVAAQLRARTFRFGLPRLGVTAQTHITTRQRALAPLLCRHASAAANGQQQQTDSSDPTNATGERTRSTEIYATNYARNEEFRDSFRDSTPEIAEQVEEVLGTTYVPPARKYPTSEATKLSLDRAKRLARVRVGHEILAAKASGRGRSKGKRSGYDILQLLRRMTQPQGTNLAMSAIRVVLPKSWSFDADSSKSVGFVEASTGLLAKLRMAGDWGNPTAVVLRGRNEVLQKAADELVEACRDVRIYKLGDVSSVDYSSKRLWPVIGEEGHGSIVPEGQLEHIWIHKEQGYWIDSAYELTPRPREWSKESFDTYIRSLVFGRLRPELAQAVYRYSVSDTDGIRVRMIIEAFEDPLARPYLTTPCLKMALRFISTRGGHRADAEHLLKMAEKWGLPLDTGAFNILLDCYATIHNARFFHMMLNKMRERFFYPDAQTWLAFLKLVQQDDMRRQVEAAMFDLDFFDDPGVRRGVSALTADYLAYQAFRAGTALPVFLEQQLARFGPDWLTVDVANAVLREFFLFHPTPDGRRGYLDHRVLVARLSAPGAGGLEASTLDLILAHCAQPHVGDWDTALWALAQMKTDGRAVQGDDPLAPTRDTYRHLVQLCRTTRKPSALGAVLFYTAKARRLRGPVRGGALAAMLGRDRDPDAHAFWSAHRPRIMSTPMANMLRDSPAPAKAAALGAYDLAVSKKTGVLMPEEPLEDILRVALKMDEKMAKEEENRPEDAAAADSNEAVTVTLVDVAGDQPATRQKITLDRAFNSRQMVWFRQGEGDVPGGRRAGSLAKRRGADARAEQDGQSPETPDAVEPETSSSEDTKAGSKDNTKAGGRENAKPGKPSQGEKGRAKEAKDGDHPLVLYLKSLL